MTHGRTYCRGKRATIGFPIQFIGDQLGGPLWRAVENAARECDVNLVTFVGLTMDPEVWRGRHIYSLAARGSVDGLVVHPGMLDPMRSDMALDFVRSEYAEVPTVCFGKPDGLHPCIHVDAAQAVRAALQHLVTVHGRSRVALIDEVEDDFAVFQQVAAEMKLTVEPKWMLRFEPHSPISLLQDLFRGDTPWPDAVLLGAGLTMRKVPRFLNQLGVVVPERSSIISLHDISTGPFFEPPLTAIRRSETEQAAQAVRALVEWLRTGNRPQDQVLPPTLEIRESCGCGSSHRAARQTVAENETLIAHLRKTLPDLLQAPFPLSNETARTAESLLASLQQALDGNDIGVFLLATRTLLRNTLDTDGEPGIWPLVLSRMLRQVEIAGRTDAEATRLRECLVQAMAQADEVVLRNLTRLRIWKSENMLGPNSPFKWILSDQERMDPNLMIASLAKVCRETGLTGRACCAVYVGTGLPSAEALVRVAWSDGQRTDVGIDGKIVETKRLLPGFLFSDDERVAVVVQSLTQPIYGYTVVESSAPDWTPYVEAHQYAYTITRLVVLQALTRKQASQLASDNAELQNLNHRIEGALAELRRNQTELVRRERLSALGEMASGIAHDFNNALVPIIAYSELLRTQPDMAANPDTVREFLESINNAARDAANVVNCLRDFYRPRDDGDVLTPQDLNLIVHQTIIAAQPRWKDQAQARGAMITVEPDTEPIPPVLGLEMELRQVLVNLIFNATDAIARQGTITVRTRARDSEVLLEVEDNGAGMSEDVCRRCIEPFFTTKGKAGTGLGLARVYGTIQRHGGRLLIRSKVGQGTCVSVFLPAAGTEAVAPAPAALPSRARRLRILIVDDEAVVLKVLEQSLKTRYDVVTAENGLRAVGEMERSKFDLMIADFSMPGMNGSELATRAREMDPGLPIIMLTGFGRFMNTVKELPKCVDLVLGKPIGIHELVQAIERTVPQTADAPAQK